MNNEDQESGFVSHLAELRKRLINIFLRVLFSKYMQKNNRFNPLVTVKTL